MTSGLACILPPRDMLGYMYMLQYALAFTLAFTLSSSCWRWMYGYIAAVIKRREKVKLDPSDHPSVLQAL